MSRHHHDGIGSPVPDELAGVLQKADQGWQGCIRKRNVQLGVGQQVSGEDAQAPTDWAGLLEEAEQSWHGCGGLLRCGLGT